jgi:hypothetical protein
MVPPPACLVRRLVRWQDRSGTPDSSSRSLSLNSPRPRWSWKPAARLTSGRDASWPPGSVSSSPPRPTPSLGPLPPESARPQQGRHRSRQRARQDHLGRLEARSALPLRTQRRLSTPPRIHTPLPIHGCNGSVDGSNRSDRRTDTPRTRMRPQGRVIRLAPCARAPLIARSTLPLHSEAGDTTAVRPSRSPTTAAKQTA